MKKILSLSTTPLFICAFQGLLYFICTIFAHLIDSTTKVVWEAGILFALCYGFISIHTLLENYFSMTLNNKK